MNSYAAEFKSYSLKCATALSKFRAQMTCAACDNTLGAKWAHGMPVNKDTLKDLLDSCVPTLYLINAFFKPTLVRALAYVKKVNPAATGFATLETALTNSKIDLSSCVKNYSQVLAKDQDESLSKLTKGGEHAKPKKEEKKRLLQAIAVKATVPKVAVKATVPKVAVKATVPKVAVKATVPKVAVKATVPKVAVKATVPAVGVKAATTPAVKAPAAKSSSKADYVVTTKGDQTWDLKSASTKSLTIEIDYSSACMSSDTFKMFLQGFVFTGMNTTLAQTILQPFMASMKLAFNELGDKKGKDIWTVAFGKADYLKFDVPTAADAKVVTDAKTKSKPAAAKTDAAKTDAAKTDAAKTDAAKTDAAKPAVAAKPAIAATSKTAPAKAAAAVAKPVIAAKKRRAQAVTPAPAAAVTPAPAAAVTPAPAAAVTPAPEADPNQISISNDGASLSNHQDTGLPHIENLTEPASANLMRMMTLLAFVLAYIIN